MVRKQRNYFGHPLTCVGHGTATTPLSHNLVKLQNRHPYFAQIVEELKATGLFALTALKRILMRFGH